MTSQVRGYYRWEKRCDSPDCRTFEVYDVDKSLADSYAEGAPGKPVKTLVDGQLTKWYSSTLKGYGHLLFCTRAQYERYFLNLIKESSVEFDA